MMKALLGLIRYFESGRILAVLVLSLIAGGLNAATLAIVNELLVASPDPTTKWIGITLGLGLAACYYLIQRRYMMSAARLSNQIVVNLRGNFLGRISRAGLPTVERLSRADITARLNSETQFIAEAATIITTFTQGAIVATLTIGYILLISPASAVLSTMIIVAIAWLYLSNNQRVERKFLEVLDREADFAANTTELLDGYAYLELDPEKMSHMLSTAGSSVASASGVRIEQQETVSRHFSITEAAFMAMLCLAVGAAGQLGLGRDGIATLAIASCFLLGPITMIGSAIPQLQRLAAAASAVETLAATLPAAEPVMDAPPRPFSTSPGSIQLDGVEYAYDGAGGSPKVGPFSFEIESGDLVLISGHNGAGKTTLVKLLTGVYAPTRGKILVDGREIDPASRSAYRQLFSAVYVDDFLLRQNIRLRSVPPAQIDALLKEMELDSRVKFVDGSFSTQRLSTGQRKRLALIEAILEPKPFLVCDEWDDTQDTRFRQKFYCDIVPRLKAAGRTVVVVSHNPQFREHADSVVEVRSRHMELVREPE